MAFDLSFVGCIEFPLIGELGEDGLKGENERKRDGSDWYVQGGPAIGGVASTDPQTEEQTGEVCVELRHAFPHLVPLS